MPKPSRARGRGGSQLGGRSAAPVGTSGRAKSQRNGAVNRRDREERVPESLVTASDESEEDEESGEEESGESGSGSGSGSAEEEDEEEQEEEEDEEEEIKIAVPVAMWVSTSHALLITRQLPTYSRTTQSQTHLLISLTSYLLAAARTSTTATLNDVPENAWHDTA
ncbi:hypothetical protein QFC22_002770 [Naganishia vaughanmartiniae]|uniref:Uncharacterized protein n=1 Tax=Naganishia vaughanmartiniae TaxID=1424756 RepID=A0ACC2XCP1_9TREE|nr:hypothetical protein QFC22_002770 [Naganishia vaughanmartiniae]